MKTQSFASHLRGTTSILALSTAALLASSGTPANAQQASSATKPLYFGGSTLASEAFRRIFDCYTGGIVGFGTAYSDGYQFTTSFPGPGYLPTTCTTANIVTTAGVNGMYAGVGSGSGIRGFVANDPRLWVSRTPVVGAAGALPATKPPFIDLANTGSPWMGFGSYPYPRVDAGLSDFPLFTTPTTTPAVVMSFSFSPTQSWSTVGGTTAFLATSSSSATYNVTAYGQPIQIPAFEVNVAVAVNTQGLTVNSAVAGTGTLPATQANQGAAIQFTTAQLCAIFSGLVTDWSDTTPNKIPYLDSTGVPQLAAFHDANKNSAGVSLPYASSSKAISVVFRGDSSGESYILTNYLKAVCPLLDPADARGYISIFGAANLPSGLFGNLIGNIGAVRGAGPWIPGTGTWIPTIGSSDVASAVSDTSGAKEGRIGFVGADFTRPYTTAIAGVGAPYSAALQNEQLRIAGVYLPNQATAGLEFIAPTPAAASTAWGDTRLQLRDDYNIYANVFPNGTSQGGANVSGRSVLPLTNRANAYPLSGATFMLLYRCYNLVVDPNRVNSLTGFLSWYYASNNPLLTSIIQVAGYNPVPAAYAASIRSNYLSIFSISRIAAAGTANTNCASAFGAL